MNNQTIKIRNMQTINNITEQTGRSPYIGENGNWFEFNDETQEFIDSGVVAQGIPGEEGKQGEPGVQGENGKDALINGVNILTLLAGENIEFEQEGYTLKIKASGGIKNIKLSDFENENETGIYIVNETNVHNSYNYQYLGVICENRSNSNLPDAKVAFLLKCTGYELVAKVAAKSNAVDKFSFKTINVYNPLGATDTWGYAPLSSSAMKTILGAANYTYMQNRLKTQNKTSLIDAINELNDTMGDIGTILSTLTTVEEVSE